MACDEVWEGSGGGTELTPCLIPPEDPCPGPELAAEGQPEGLGTRMWRCRCVGLGVCETLVQCFRGCWLPCRDPAQGATQALGWHPGVHNAAHPPHAGKKECAPSLDVAWLSQGVFRGCKVPWARVGILPRLCPVGSTGKFALSPQGWLGGDPGRHSSAEPPCWRGPKKWTRCNKNS